MLKSVAAGILCILISASITHRVNGQAALFILLFGDKVASQKFHLSMHGGINISNFCGLDDGKSLIGLYFGLGSHLKLSDNWYLVPEFKPVSTKGVAA